MGYNLDGRLLEVCDCNVLCPCWIGEAPDNGTCQGTVGWHIDSGTIDGVDVSGRSFIITGHIPGNVLDGNWKMLAILDEGTSKAQADAILKVWTGQAGGPVADLAKLVGEVVGVEMRKITFAVEGGKGTLKVEGILEAELEPYQGTTGMTTLNDSVFSTIPGSPAYVSKAQSYTRTTSRWGLSDVNLTGHNAVQGSFHFEA